MKKNSVSQSVIRRLPRYFRYLSELSERGITRISSKELSSMMKITASQIRQDLNCFGGFGQQGYGYNIEALLSEIKTLLGADRRNTAIIIGMGNIGSALAKNMNFKKRGVFLIGLFDVSADKIGKQYGDLEVKSSDELETFCRENHPDIAILYLPKTLTQPMAKLLYSYGVKAFWNFASTEIDIDGASVENVHMGDSLMLLCYDIANRKG